MSESSFIQSVGVRNKKELFDEELQATDRTQTSLWGNYVSLINIIRLPISMGLNPTYCQIGASAFSLCPQILSTNCPCSCRVTSETWLLLLYIWLTAAVCNHTCSTHCCKSILRPGTMTNAESIVHLSWYISMTSLSENRSGSKMIVVSIVMVYNSAI